MVQPLRKTVRTFLKKIKIEIPYDPDITFLGIDPEESKAGSLRDMCTPVLMAALSAIAKMWKQFKYPLRDEWTSKMWNGPMMEYYSALERKEVLTHATVGMSLENIMGSEGSQSQKDTDCLIPFR